MSREAEAGGLVGQAVTPFLLQRVNELSAGESLRANISLVKHNAVVGSAVARALAEEANNNDNKPPPSHGSGGTARGPSAAPVSRA